MTLSVSIEIDPKTILWNARKSLEDFDSWCVAADELIETDDNGYRTSCKRCLGGAVAFAATGHASDLYNDGQVGFKVVEPLLRLIVEANPEVFTSFAGDADTQIISFNDDWAFTDFGPRTTEKLREKHAEVLEVLDNTLEELNG